MNINMPINMNIHININMNFYINMQNELEANCYEYSCEHLDEHSNPIITNHY